MSKTIHPQSDTSSKVDMFQEQTHQNIADLLFEITHANNVEGKTIGLEGTWGSGKSTIIQLFCQKINKEKSRYFYFDAWEHEGDSLRKTFLEEYIKQCVHKPDKKVRETTQWLSSKTKFSTGAKWFSFSALLVPLGGVITSHYIEDIVIKFGRQPHVPFLTGCCLMLSPLLVVIIFKLISYLKSKNDTQSRSAFILSGAQELDKSSIDFERKFMQLTNHLFVKEKIERILIVIDNLDRVNSEDSLRIWSTLQTYLQFRNPTGNNKDASLYKKIWTIVPYDEVGLKKVWQKENDKACPNSFFDKCFQLRLEVPTLVVDDWIDFTKKILSETLPNWSEMQRNEAIQILQETRTSITDALTPREIKTFANQIGILNKLHPELSISAVSLFSILRYIKLKSKKEIGTFLAESNKKELLLADITERTLRELCGLLYGISPDKGAQIVLTKRVCELVKASDHEHLIELEKNYQDTFWHVLPFCILANEMNNVDEVVNFTFIIENCFNDIYPQKARVFSIYLFEKIKGWQAVQLPLAKDSNKYLSLFKLLTAFCLDNSFMLKQFAESINLKEPDEKIPSKN